MTAGVRRPLSVRCAVFKFSYECTLESRRQHRRAWRMLIVELPILPRDNVLIRSFVARLCVVFAGRTDGEPGRHRDFAPAKVEFASRKITAPNPRTPARPWQCYRGRLAVELRVVK